MHASAPITGLRFLSAIATAAVASRLADLRHLIKNLIQFIYRSRRAVRFEFQTASGDALLGYLCFRYGAESRY